MQRYKSTLARQNVCKDKVSKTRQLNIGHNIVHIAHPQLTTNIHTKYQLPVPHPFKDGARARFLMSRPLQQGQRLNQSHTMALHAHTTQTNLPTKFQLPTHYGFRDIARQDFINQHHYGKVRVLNSVQQPGSYWNRSKALPHMGVEPTQRC